MQHAATCDEKLRLRECHLKGINKKLYALDAATPVNHIKSVDLYKYGRGEVHLLTTKPVDVIES